MSAAGLSPEPGDWKAPLRCVTYVSENLVAGSPAGWAAEIEDILFCSRRANAAVDVTGALMATDRHFVQVLEGGSASLILALDRIRSDSRHRIIRLEERPLDRRRFAGWSMAYLGPDCAEPQVLLPVRHFAEASGDVAAVLLMMQYLLDQAPQA